MNASPSVTTSRLPWSAFAATTCGSASKSPPEVTILRDELRRHNAPGDVEVDAEIAMESTASKTSNSPAPPHGAGQRQRDIGAAVARSNMMIPFTGRVSSTARPGRAIPMSVLTANTTAVLENVNRHGLWKSDPVSVPATSHLVRPSCAIDNLALLYGGRRRAVNLAAWKLVTPSRRLSLARDDLRA